MKPILLVLLSLLLLGLTVYGQSGMTVGRRPAPNLNLVTLDNRSIDTNDLKGKVIVYNLWYLSCPPCREEIPQLNELVREYKDRDVVFIALTTDDQTSLAGFLKEIPFTYQIVPSAAQIMLLNFGNTQDDGSLYIPFPTHVVVDREGFVEVEVAGKKGVVAVREELKRQFADNLPGGANPERQ